MDERLQDLMDRVKGTAGTVGEWAGYGAQKVNGAISTTKLKLEIADLERQTEGLLRQIGETVYDTHCGQLTDTSHLLGKLSQIDDLKLAQRSQDLHLYKDQKVSIPAKDNLKLQNEIFEWSITRNNQYHLMNKRVAELICDQSLYNKTYYDQLEHWDRSLARTAKDSE